MPALAGALSFEPPRDFMCRMKQLSSNYFYTKLLWAGIGEDTRKHYATAVRSYEEYCHMSKVCPWPATRRTLGPWIVTRAFGSAISRNLHQVSATTLSGYVSALRSVHVDLDLPTEVFESQHIRRLLAGAANLFPKRSRERKLFITRQLLIDLISTRATEGESEHDTLNLNAAFTLAFSGFLRMGEFTWGQKEPQRRRTFAATRPTRGCITFDPYDGAMDFYLPRSKSDTGNNGVNISIVPAPDTACAYQHMKQLLNRTQGSRDDPLFSLTAGPFTRARVLNALNRRLGKLGIPPGSYTGHSFRRGAAQHAHEMEVPKSEIQYMGRWASNAVERYYQRSRKHQLKMQKIFHFKRAVRYEPLATNHN